MATLRHTVYVETSILSFLCAEQSLVLATAAKQDATRQWWEIHRARYDVYTSSEVVIEAARGQTDYATRRLAKAAELMLIAAVPADHAMAAELIAAKLVPVKAKVDATHLAIAIRTRMTFLLTWNLTHLANPSVLPMVYDYLIRTNRHRPVVTTPGNLLDSLAGKALL